MYATFFTSLSLQPRIHSAIPTNTETGVHILLREVY
jgi:hypothetical protein